MNHPPTATYTAANPETDLNVLLQIWWRLERSMSTADEAHADNCVAEQREVLNQMSAIQAKNSLEVMLKLIAWRLDALAQSLDSLNESERLAVSALYDLARIAGAKSDLETYLRANAA